MKRIPSVITVAAIVTGILLLTGASYYIFTKTSNAPPHVWQPHEILGLAIFFGLWCAGSSIGSGLEKIAKSIDNHASAVREAYRAIEHLVRGRK